MDGRGSQTGFPQRRGSARRLVLSPRSAASRVGKKWPPARWRGGTLSPSFPGPAAIANSRRCSRLAYLLRRRPPSLWPSGASSSSARMSLISSFARESGNFSAAKLPVVVTTRGLIFRTGLSRNGSAAYAHRARQIVVRKRQLATDPVTSILVRGQAAAAHIVLSARSSRRPRRASGCFHRMATRFRSHRFRAKRRRSRPHSRSRTSNGTPRGGHSRPLRSCRI